MKQTIAQLKEDIKAAKTRQEEANKDVKRIERDMSDFRLIGREQPFINTRTKFFQEFTYC
jgi:hypothetical protein